MGSKKEFARHPSYDLYADQWQKCRMASEGEDAVKAAGAVYLPPLEGSEQTGYQEDYATYKARASFYGATGRTVQGLTGAVMRKPPTIQGEPWHTDTSKDLAVLLLPVGFSGEQLISMVHDSVEDCVEVGRIGHLIDAVPEQEATSEEEKLPYVVAYKTEDIVTWHEEIVRGRRRLVLVVLREVKLTPSTDPEDLLEMKPTVQFRVLSLRKRGAAGTDEDMFLPTDFDDGEYVYTQELWEVHDDDPREKDKLVLVDSVVPRRIGGRPLDYIPFRFTNWSGESPKPSKPPLVDLVNVNLSHYRNSADLEHGRHYTALPTPVVMGFKLDGTVLEIGSRRAWVSEDPGADAKMLEFTGAGLGHLQDGMKHKEQQMAVLGARFLEGQRPGAEKPEALKLRQSGDASVLSNVADSVGDSWSWILNKMWDWARLDEASTPFALTLNTDFAALQLDSQMLTSLTSALQTGSISWETYVEQLQRGEIIDSKVTPEEEAERIAAGVPSASLGTPSNNSPFPGAPGSKDPEDPEDDPDDGGEG